MTLAPSLRALVFRNYHRTRRDRANVVMQSSAAKDLLFPMRRYYVCIMASESRVLYIGITNDIRRRVWEHKSNINPAASRSCLCGAGALARALLGRILRSFAPPGRRGRLPLRDSRADTLFTALYTARVS